MRNVCIILTFFLAISLSCKSDKKDKLKTDEKVDIYKDLNGLSVSLDQFKGKRILVNYWAAWCVPCLKEFPSLVEAQEILSQDNYVFLFPSPDGIEEIKKFNENHKYPLQFLALNKSLDKLDIYALPSTTIYKTDGSVYKKIDGATNWSSPEIIEMLKSVP